MRLVEQSQDGLVPQLQANLTRWPQLPRKASVLTSHPAGQVPLNHLTGPVCSCRRVACPSWLPWPSSVFYDVAVGCTGPGIRSTRKARLVIGI